MWVPGSWLHAFSGSASAELPLSTSHPVPELPSPSQWPLCLPDTWKSLSRLLRFKLQLLIPPLPQPSSSGRATLPIAQSKSFGAIFFPSLFYLFIFLLPFISPIWSHFLLLSSSHNQGDHVIHYINCNYPKQIMLYGLSTNPHPVHQQKTELFFKKYIQHLAILITSCVNTLAHAFVVSYFCNGFLAGLPNSTHASHLQICSHKSSNKSMKMEVRSCYSSAQNSQWFSNSFRRIACTGDLLPRTSGLIYTLPFSSHSAKATSVFLLFTQVKYTLTSWPLPLLFPLPRTLPQITTGLSASLPSGLASLTPYINTNHFHWLHISILIPALLGLCKRFYFLKLAIAICIVPLVIQRPPDSPRTFSLGTHHFRGSPN